MKSEAAETCFLWAAMLLEIQFLTMIYCLCKENKSFLFQEAVNNNYQHQKENTKEK